MTHFIILEIRKCRLMKCRFFEVCFYKEKLVSFSHSLYPFYMSVNLAENAYWFMLTLFSTHFT
jgi:hypothetical protein